MGPLRLTSNRLRWPGCSQSQQAAGVAVGSRFQSSFGLLVRAAQVGDNPIHASGLAVLEPHKQTNGKSGRYWCSVAVPILD